ncbi:MAG: hypothetical protein SFW62_02680 [Alphaproteobacteria bacterium]|nr:hypothetical protein [Alphaproteobacteria bacterium]
MSARRQKIDEYLRASATVVGQKAAQHPGVAAAIALSLFAANLAWARATTPPLREDEVLAAFNAGQAIVCGSSQPFDRGELAKDGGLHNYITGQIQKGFCRIAGAQPT